MAARCKSFICILLCNLPHETIEASASKRYIDLQVNEGALMGSLWLPWNDHDFVSTWEPQAAWHCISQTRRLIYRFEANASNNMLVGIWTDILSSTDDPWYGIEANSSNSLLFGMETAIHASIVNRCSWSGSCEDNWKLVADSWKLKLIADGW